MGELAEGVGPQLIGSGPVSRHRELDDDGQGLALELFHGIGHRRQAPYRSRGVGTGCLVGRPLPTARCGRLWASPPGGPDGAVDLSVGKSQPSGEPAGVLALERSVPDTCHDRRR